MNALELAYQLSSISIDSGSTSTSVAPLPFELDCSEFDSLSPAPSLTSSFNSLSSNDNSTRQSTSSGLSRSRCSHNLSSIGSSFSDGSTSSKRRRISSSDSPPRRNENWGYFADTQH